MSSTSVVARVSINGKKTEGVEVHFDGKNLVLGTEATVDLADCEGCHIESGAKTVVVQKPDFLVKVSVGRVREEKSALLSIFDKIETYCLENIEGFVKAPRPTRRGSLVLKKGDRQRSMSLLPMLRKSTSKDQFNKNKTLRASGEQPSMNDNVSDLNKSKEFDDMTPPSIDTGELTADFVDDAMQPVTEASLVYLRTKLQAQLVSGRKGTKEFGDALNQLEEVTAKRHKLQKKLRAVRKELKEAEAQYYGSAPALAESFKKLSRHVKKLVDGPIAFAFVDLRAELGEDDGSSSYGGESANDPDPEPASPETRKSGWVRAKPDAKSVEKLLPTSGSEAEAHATFIERFKRLVFTLEAGLSLSRPLADMAQGLAERRTDVENEIVALEKRLEMNQRLVNEVNAEATKLATYTTNADALSKGLQTLETHQDEDIREWLKAGEGKQELKDALEAVVSVKMPAKQDAFSVVSGESTVSSEDIKYADDGALASGTAEALYELLVTGEGQRRDPMFNKAYIYGFRSWLTPLSLLELMVQTFCVTLPPEFVGHADENKYRNNIVQARHRVLNLMAMWIVIHEYDFTDRKFSRLMHSFLDTATTAGYQAGADKLRDTLRGNAFYEGVAGSAYPDPILPKDLSNFSLVDLDPLELARQITLQDSSLYQGMLTRELMDCQWTKKGKDAAPTVKVITQRFNLVAQFVVSTIVAEEELPRRIKALELWIQTAEHLVGLQNFNGVMQIIASLSKTEVNRLKKTIGGCSKKMMAVWSKLRAMLAKNCVGLREAYTKSTPPCLPYIGTYMQDLTFIGEMPTKLDNGHVNYRKLLLQGNSFEALLGRRSSILYRLKEVKEIRQFICREDLCLSEDEAYAQSLKVEPRAKT